MKTRSVGRPPRSKDGTYDRITVRVNRDESRAWRRAAGKKTLSDWIRGLCNQPASPPKIT